MHSPMSPRGVYWWYETDEMIATVIDILADATEGEDD